MMYDGLGEDIMMDDGLGEGLLGLVEERCMMASSSSVAGTTCTMAIQQLITER